MLAGQRLRLASLLISVGWMLPALSLPFQGRGAGRNGGAPIRRERSNIHATNFNLVFFEAYGNSSAMH
jgi:hypothetical protein